MASDSIYSVRIEIVINTKTLEQVSRLNIWKVMFRYENDNDIKYKINTFKNIRRVIYKTLRSRSRSSTRIRLYKTIAVPTLPYVSEKRRTNAVKSKGLN